MDTLGSIQLFFCPLEPQQLSQTDMAELTQWLSPTEQSKVGRYKRLKDQQQGLMVRAYLRAVLSHVVAKLPQLEPIFPQQWQFEYGEKGKPRLTKAQYQQTGIDFNISHSGHWLLIGVHLDTPKPINPADEDECTVEKTLAFGVDIERLRPSVNIHAILSHYFSLPETNALTALPESQQRQRFFDLWALKESYIKAKGLGLALSLKTFAFDLANLTYQPLTTQPLIVQPFSAQSSADTSDVTIDSLNNITLASGIKLDIQTDEQGFISAPQWQCYLGQLDEQYRFAVSVNRRQNTAVEELERVRASYVDRSWLLDCYQQYSSK